MKTVPEKSAGHDAGPRRHTAGENCPADRAGACTTAGSRCQSRRMSLLVPALDAYKKRQLAAIESDRQTLSALQGAIAQLGLQKQL